MKGLTYLALLCALLVTCAAKEFHLAVMVCVWRRPLLAELVLKELAGVRVDGLRISLVVVGSEGDVSRKLADGVGALYVETANSPLGKKHNEGLKATRALNPDAVAVMGSDDLVNAKYFEVLRDSFVERCNHIFGLRDVYFLDLATNVIGYTAGYNVAHLETAATVGLGRAYSKEVLDQIQWHLWDDERDRGLDQSAVRRILTQLPLVDTVSESIVARNEGILALDVKTKGLDGGANIWSFEDIKKGCGKDKNLKELEIFDISLIKQFGGDLEANLQSLRTMLVDGQSSHDDL